MHWWFDLEVSISTCEPQILEWTLRIWYLDIIVSWNWSLNVEGFSSNFFGKIFLDISLLFILLPVASRYNFEMFHYINEWVLPEGGVFLFGFLFLLLFVCVKSWFAVSTSLRYRHGTFIADSFIDGCIRWSLSITALSWIHIVWVKKFEFNLFYFKFTKFKYIWF